MLRYTTFAIVSLFACGVASAQYPITPFGGYHRPTANPALNCPNGFCGTTPQSCVGGNCATGQMICGPDGCYAPGTAPGSVNPYLPGAPLGGSWTQPAASWRYRTPTSGYYQIQPYPLPGSGYPGYPNVPAPRRDRYRACCTNLTTWFRRVPDASRVRDAVI
jgi:hypothetical protein